MENGKIENHTLWDDGETSWEPLSAIIKDDPVKLAEYKREKKLRNKRG